MSLVKETRRPRLRTASMLFGVVAVSSSTAAATYVALNDRQGAPACGNIGQRGVTNVTFNAPVIEVMTAPADALEHVDPLQRVDTPIARPLVDDDGAPAPGNVMRKRPGP